MIFFFFLPFSMRVIRGCRETWRCNWTLKSARTWAPLSFPPAYSSDLGALFHLLGDRHSRSLPAGGTWCTTVTDDDAGRRCQGRLFVCPSVCLFVYSMRHGLSNVSLEDTWRKSNRPCCDICRVSENKSILFIRDDSQNCILMSKKLFILKYYLYISKLLEIFGIFWRNCKIQSRN